MCGNASEWVEDDYHKDYNGAPMDGSAWLDRTHDGFRVIRGGNIAAYSEDSCTACRDREIDRDNNPQHNVGMRLVRTLP